MDIKLLRDNAQLPTKGSEYAAGYDLYAATEKVGFDDWTMNASIEIPPHETKMIPTGIAIAIPNGMWGGVFARSGLATKQGLRPANCVDVIDSDYRGEIFVALHNDTNEPRWIHDGDRIAQLVILPVFYEPFIIVEELDNTARGSNGFGSTGTK